MSDDPDLTTPEAATADALEQAQPMAGVPAGELFTGSPEDRAIEEEKEDSGQGT